MSAEQQPSDSLEIRSNTQRKRRTKQTQEHMPPADPSAASDSGSSRRRTKTSTTSRNARPSSSSLWSGSGSSALGSQLSSPDSSRSFLPSLGRIAEGRPSNAGDASDTTSLLSGSSSRRRIHFARRGPARYPAETQRRLQERVRAALTSPSMQSVLSSLTATTSSSSGSNSTVTQGSYDSTLPRRKDSRRTHTQSYEEEARERRRRRREHRDPPREPPDEKVNVFNYLEPQAQAADQEMAWSSAHHSSTSDESDGESDGDPRRSYTPASSTTQPSSESSSVKGKKTANRQTSPQGSTRSSSSRAERRSVSNPDDGVGPSLEQEQAGRPVASSSPSWSRRSSASGSSERRSVQSQHLPPPYSTATSSLVPYSMPQPTQLATVHVPPPAPEPPTPPSPTRKRKQARVSGYELLASKLSTRAEQEPDKLLPLYRRFERLNHRILLHLQDEIAEMEEHLQYLDDCIAHASKAGGELPPASRRMEQRYGGEMHFQRTELLGRIFIKINQYNEALAAYSSSIKGFGAAEREEVERYRRTMAKLQPITSEELRFLEHDADLIHFKAAAETASKTQDEGVAAATATDRLLLAAAAAPPAALLAALLLFLMAASPAARALLVLVLSGAGWMALHSAQALHWIPESRERIACFCLYTALLAVMATCIR